MLANSFFATTVVFLAAGYFFLDQCRFLIPYRDLILAAYGAKIAVFAAILFTNVLAGLFAFSRRFLLKDTGKKLAYLERQLRSRQSISEELSRRIEDAE